MLDILDYTKQELISDADFWQIAGEHLEKPIEFKGVSFVSSIKFIEEQLLPRYDKVTLILGLSDNGKEDGSLRLLFTKHELIHTKMYLMTSDDRYLSFAGSMNLTEAAIHHNLEQLDSDYGTQTDPLYQCHVQMFNDNLRHATTYLDAKKMAGFIKAKNKEQLQINVYTDTLYQCHVQMFNDNLRHATTYLDAKKMAGFIKAKIKDQLQINVYTDTVNMVKNKDTGDQDEVIIPAEEV